MVEALIKKTTAYKTLLTENNNYIREMTAKQTKIRIQNHTIDGLNKQLAETEAEANKIILEKQKIINDLINELEIKEKQRKTAVGKASALKRQIKKLEKENQDIQERSDYYKNKLLGD